MSDTKYKIKFGPTVPDLEEQLSEQGFDLVQPAKWQRAIDSVEYLSLLGIINYKECDEFRIRTLNLLQISERIIQ